MTEEERKEIIRFHLVPTDYRLIFRVIALFVSWFYNKSILWGVIHFFLGWVYIAYVLFMGGFDEGRLNNIINYYIN
jgi:hypothetical protein